MDLFLFCSELCRGKLDQQMLELEQLANKQLVYTNPLKPATQADEHMFGEHNKKTVEKLKDLKEHLLSLCPIA